MSDPNERITQLEGKVSLVENEMSTLREHMDERFDSGKVRMNDMQVTIEKMSSSITDLHHSMTHTQRDLIKHMEVEEAQRTTLLESLAVIQKSAEKTSAFFSDVGKIKPEDMRANHDWTVRMRKYGDKAIFVAIGLGVVGLIWLVQNGGSSVGP